MCLSTKQKLGYWGWLLWGFLFIVITAEPIEAANDLAAKEKALGIIAEFASKICYEVQQKGKQLNWEIEGGASAELSGLIKKLVALKIEGVAKYEKSEYQGVLRNDLATALEKSTDCKLEVFRELKDDLLKLDRDDDDPLHLYDDNVEEMRKSTLPPSMERTFIALYIMGSFPKKVARYGKNYKTYWTPTYDWGDGAQRWYGRPSAEFNEQGQKFRRVTFGSHRIGQSSTNISEKIYIWKLGDWILHKESKYPAK